MTRRRQRHRWEAILAPGVRKLQQGVDFRVSVSGASMQGQIQRAARERQIEVRTELRTADGVDWIRVTVGDGRSKSRGIYPWAEWLRVGHEVRLVRGEHFQTPATSFRVTALQAAERRGLDVKSSVAGDVVTLETLGKMIETESRLPVPSTPATETAPPSKE